MKYISCPILETPVLIVQGWFFFSETTACFWISFHVWLCIPIAWFFVVDFFYTLCFLSIGLFSITGVCHSCISMWIFRSYKLQNGCVDCLCISMVSNCHTASCRFCSNPLLFHSMFGPLFSFDEIPVHEEFCLLSKRKQGNNC